MVLGHFAKFTFRYYLILSDIFIICISRTFYFIFEKESTFYNQNFGAQFSLELH